MKKSYFLFTISLLLSGTIVAQTRIAAQADIGGTGADILVTVCRGTDGALLEAGYSESNKSMYKSQDSKGQGYFDFWVVKSVRNKKGKIVEQWDKTIGGDNQDYLAAAAPTRNGGYYLGGLSYSNQSGDKSDPGVGIWIVKIDKEGNIVWDTTLVSLYPFPKLYPMDSTSDGGVILTTDFYNAASGYNAAIPDVIILDASGHVVLNKPTYIYNSAQKEAYESVRHTADGGFIFAGYDDGQLSLFKTDSGINEIWKTAFYAKGAINHRYEARELKNGDYVLFGSEATDLYYDGEEIPADYYFYFFKTDHAGKQLWSSNEYEDVNDGNIVAFEETSTGDNLVSYKIDYIPVVKKLDSTGHLKWVDTIKSYYSRIQDIKELEPSTYLYSMTSNAGITDEKTKPNLGDFDYWFIAVKDTAATGAPLIDERISAPVQKQDVFTVYPIPAKDQLHVQVDGTATVSLMDVNGKIIVRQIIQNSSSINVEKLPAGIYYLKNESTNTAKKIIITK